MEELRRRALASTEGDVVVLAGGQSSPVRRDGVVAGTTPRAPDRSIPNAVFYDDPDALRGAYAELEDSYARAGVRAWTVWVPDHDRATASFLEQRGHSLDGAPRAMSLWLEDLAEGPPPGDGVVAAKGSAAEVGRLNDLAYGTEGPGFEAALEGGEISGVQRDFAAAGGELISCVATLECADDDVLVTCVATLPAWRGRGIAGRLLREVLARRHQEGVRSASLRASALGAGVYERLGFIDHGFVELWEKRTG